ncbi:MAG: Atg14 domain-containing protein [Saprospiraceae bacterium]|nr:Atg14 domain-containing protein [Saprospiraceae bacterium]MDW8483291.1 hypothetical protein [Saprospiraceae bacterium]
MSSFLRKALRLFVVLDEPAEGTADASAAANSSSKTSEEKAQPVLSAAELDKYERHFQQLFENANLPGPDYFEFWQTMEALEAHVPDEGTRMKAAFASLQVQGLDKAKLLHTAVQYRDILLQDKVNFEAAAQQKIQLEIGGRQSEWQTLKQQNDERLRQIAQLQQEIAASEKRMEQLQREIEQEKSKIEQVQRGYIAACEAMIAKINNDIQRLEQIL